MRALSGCGASTMGEPVVRVYVAGTRETHDVEPCSTHSLLTLCMCECGSALSSEAQPPVPLEHICAALAFGNQSSCIQSRSATG